MHVALFVSRSTIPLVSKGAMRNFIQSSGLSDGEVGKSIRFGARCNESGKSKLYTPHLSEICDVREFF